MKKSEPSKSKPSNPKDECMIPPELPKEQLHKLMFRHSEEEAQVIREGLRKQTRFWWR